MTARIFVFKRRNGDVFKWASNTLLNAGYKLRMTNKGHLEAVTQDVPVMCPECKGTGAIQMIDGYTLYCWPCSGKGTY